MNGDGQIREQQLIFTTSACVACRRTCWTQDNLVDIDIMYRVVN